MLIISIIFIFSCATPPPPHGYKGEIKEGKEGYREGKMKSKPEFRLLVVRIFPTDGYSAAGVIYFEKLKEGIAVKGKIEGLSPGLHGFHIHTYGDMSLTDGKAAGGHFNPGEKPHGAMEAEERHIGDLGNIEAGPDGTAVIDILDKRISFYGKNAIIGRGVIIHEKPDDYGQPTGNAGARVGYGVIGIAKPE